MKKRNQTRLQLNNGGATLQKVLRWAAVFAVGLFVVACLEGDLQTKSDSSDDGNDAEVLSIESQWAESYRPGLVSESVDVPTEATGRSVYTGSVHVNMLGYMPGSTKIAVITDSSTSPRAFEVRDASTNIKVWPAAGTQYTTVVGNDFASGEHVHRADFTALTTAGEYKVYVNGAYSVAFEIGTTYMDGLAEDVANYFYAVRSAEPILATHLRTGSKHLARAASNTGDTALGLYPASSGSFNVAGGVYDAGSTGHYNENTVVMIWRILNLYELHKDSYNFSGWNLNIPESGNSTPDLVDIAEDGAENIAGFLPAGSGLATHKCHDNNYVSGPRACMDSSTTATYAIARMAAQLARTLQATNASLATTYWAIAEDAWGRADGTSKIYPSSMDNGGAAGGYKDMWIDDDRYAAAAEMYLTAYQRSDSSVSTYKTAVVTNPHAFDVYEGSDWGENNYMDINFGSFSLLAAASDLSSAQLNTIKNNLEIQADAIINAIDNQGYPSPIPSGDEYPWGSNGTVLDSGIILINAYKHLDDVKYLKAAYQVLDYILGNNPMNSSYAAFWGEYSITGIADVRAMSNPGGGAGRGWMAGGPLNAANFQPPQFASPVCDDSQTPRNVAEAKGLASGSDPGNSWCSLENTIDGQSALLHVVKSLEIIGDPAPAAPTCSDGVQNQDETGVDCGGVCPACAAPTCVDGILNQDETGVDCGGVCPACPTCSDGILNQDEIGVDCGGVCDACSGTSDVTIEAEDYDSMFGVVLETADTTVGYFDGGDWMRYNNISLDNVYAMDVVVAGEFGGDNMEVRLDSTSGTLIGTFTMTATGGWEIWQTQTFALSAASGAHDLFLVGVGGEGILNIDSFTLLKNATPTCSDGVQNQDETGVDCGGVCSACPTCSDGVQNQDETGVDCGGVCTACPSCSDGVQNQDETGVDCGGVCLACPSCADGVQNQGEEGIDCGGPCPAACPSCDDGIMNQDETGVDCGGVCTACPSCFDGVLNQDEVLIDCGGVCAACDCLVDGDCDDNLYCNGVESCNSFGSCVAGTSIDCDDGVDCTIDACNEASDSCDNTADDGFCDDGLFCNGTETCDVVSDCVSGSDPCVGLSCDDDTDECVVGPAVHYSFNMDTNPGWTTEGSWAWGTPDGLGGQYGGPDPDSGYTGSNVYGYNLSGDYAANEVESHLTTTAIDCSVLEDVTLKFWRWLGVETSQYDHAYIRVSNDGITWTDIWSNPAAETADTAWTAQEFDISTIADGEETVYIRWTQGTSDEGWQYCGWNIDDVEIWGTVVNVEPSCTDGILNQDETAIDCGGTICGACPTCDDGILNQGEDDVDCGGPCTACPSCFDGILNQDETDVDCGGAICAACPTCSDGIQNQDETGVDCGGATCGVCPTCDDGIMNQDETDVDCGGATCAACPSCNDGIQNQDETGIDCGGSICGTCPTCDDGIMNQDETGIDCGGASCAACPSCDDGIMNQDETDVDCGGVCSACPTCSDGIQNQDETGVDCGGSSCSVCETCSDGIQNQDETGVDCGGSSCSACETCSDGIQNQDETGVDCGGSSCSACSASQCDGVAVWDQMTPWTSYTLGDKRQHNNVLYECINTGYSQYEPGTSAGDLAWSSLGGC